MLNDIKLHGYLGRDPEISEVDGKNGEKRKKASFSIGVSRDYGDDTDWFFCVMYGNRADVIGKYFHKGSQIVVSGRMESYKPKKDPDRTAWLVKVYNFDFCDKSGTGSNKQQKSDIPETMEEIDEDVPF